MGDQPAAPREIRISYHPTFEQVYEVLRTCGAISPWKQRLNFFLPAFLYTLACIVFYQKDVKTWWPAYAYMAGLSVWRLLFWPTQAKQRFRRLWEKSPSEGLETVATLNDESISFESSAGITLLKWLMFTGCKENEGYFICQTPLYNYYIPKFALTESQTEEIRALLHTKIFRRLADRTNAFEIVQTTSVQEPGDVHETRDHG